MADFYAPARPATNLGPPAFAVLRTGRDQRDCVALLLRGSSLLTLSASLGPPGAETLAVVDKDGGAWRCVGIRGLGETAVGDSLWRLLESVRANAVFFDVLNDVRCSPLCFMQAMLLHGAPGALADRFGADMGLPPVLPRPTAALPRSFVCDVELSGLAEDEPGTLRFALRFAVASLDSGLVNFTDFAVRIRRAPDAAAIHDEVRLLARCATSGFTDDPLLRPVRAGWPCC